MHAKAADDQPWLSPPKVAELIGVSHAKVLHWIDSGELRAVNVASNQGGRPRFKISRADLESFLARRSTTAEPTPRRQRVGQEQGVIEFYEE